MEGLFGLLFLLALVCCGVFAVMAIIKKLKKQPAKKSLKLAGISLLVSFVAMIITGIVAPDVPVSTQSNSGKTVATEKSPATTEPTSAADETLKAATEVNSTPETTAPTEKPQTTPEQTAAYTGDALKSTFANYMKSKKDADKSNLKESDPDELYGMVISTLKALYSPYVTSVNGPYYEFDGECAKYVEAYNDIFSDSANSKNLLAIRDSVRQAYKNNSEKFDLRLKYGDENYLRNFRYSYASMDFYILNALSSSYTDSTTAKLLKKASVYGSAIPKAFAATSDTTYNSLVGDMPGETYCVVQPIDEYVFSKQGVYTLNVIADGEAELVDDKGFKNKGTVYVEVSDDYIEAVSKDANRYFELSDDAIVAEHIVKTLLGISESHNSYDFSNYYGYYQCNKHTTESTGFALTLDISNNTVEGILNYSYNTTSCMAEFTAKLESNTITSAFEDSFGGVGTLTLTIYDNYAFLDLKYNGGNGQFPEGVSLMSTPAN